MVDVPAMRTVLESIFVDPDLIWMALHIVSGYDVDIGFVHNCNYIVDKTNELEFVLTGGEGTAIVWPAVVLAGWPDVEPIGVNVDVLEFRFAEAFPTAAAIEPQVAVRKVALLRVCLALQLDTVSATVDLAVAEDGANWSSDHAARADTSTVRAIRSLDPVDGADGQSFNLTIVANDRDGKRLPSLLPVEHDRVAHAVVWADVGASNAVSLGSSRSRGR
jgi:hypothetical protein